MKNQDTLYWVWLAEKCGPASKDFTKIIEKYQDPFDVYLLDNDEIEQLKDLGDRTRAALCQKDLDPSYDIMTYCKQNRVDIISYGDRRYPERLKMLQDPPIVLYCKGHFPEFDTRLSIGVVGTRSMSEYGKQSAYRISYDLAASSVLTVSGMALGIDGVCACASLTAGGETVAVLGCGIDTVYPKHHAKLYEQICRHGAVITEYSPHEKPYGHNFPKRNRIISGLCQGVLVVEGSEGSGSLITAELAIGQGRQVFAVPGKISDAGAEGPNRLIKEGSYSATCAADILKHYEFLYGDVCKKRRSAKKDISADAALEALGLHYAVSGAKEEQDEIFLPKKERKTKKNTVAEPVTEQEVSVAEESGAISVDSLDPITRRIFESLPQDRAVSADAVVGDGISASDAITSLSLLELYGLISSLPGGLYIRK